MNRKYCSAVSCQALFPSESFVSGLFVARLSLCFEGIGKSPAFAGLFYPLEERG
jgi:hypothetical protein